MEIGGDMKMRTWIIALAFVGSMSVAQAGDGYGEARPFTWTGFYIGAHGGVATGDTSGRTDLGFVTVETDYDMSGGIWGGHVGYNYQRGRTVLGVEGTWSALDMQGDTSCVGGLFNCSRSTDWVATVVGRLGMTMDRAMVYGLAGVAWGEVESNSEGLFGLVQTSGNATHVGWVAGVGLEYAVTQNIVARVEYNHIDLGSETHDLDLSFGGVPAGVTLPSKVDMTVDTVKVGVSWKFN
jgi:outer membrane immunogenic protein